jgi:hypothetical protein
VEDANGQAAVRLEHPSSLTNTRVKIIEIHQDVVGDGKVERRIFEREMGGISYHRSSWLAALGRRDQRR